MKTLIAIALTGGLFAAVSSAQPVITQISNAASANVAPLPNANIAQGSFMAIYGTAFAASTGIVWNTSYPLGSPSAGLNGSVVAVTSGSTTTNALIYYAGPGGTGTQINAVMPSTVPPGAATVTVTFGGATSAAFPITVIASTVGTFAVNFAGSGPGIITDASYAVFTPFHTATPNQVVILWGSGLGPTPAAYLTNNEDGQVPPCPQGCDFRPNQTSPASIPGANLAVTVYVGGVAAPAVEYAGRAPNLTALDQIVFTVPSGVTGCYVPVAVQSGPIGGTQVTSNFTSMTVDPSGTSCSDADGINFADLASAVTAKGSANVAAISLLSNYVPLNILGTILNFDNDTVNGEIGTFSTAVLSAFQGFTISPSAGTAGSCTVSQFLGFPPPDDPELGLVTYLDAGADLTISGGQGTMPSQMVPQNSDGKGYGQLVGGAYITCPADNPGCPSLFTGSGEAPYFLDSGTSAQGFTDTGVAAATYTVTGPGGSNVGSFSATITVSSQAAAFSWTNASIVNNPIPRTTPLTINWTGGDPNGFVDISAIASTTTALVPAKTTPGAFMECLVPASLGTFNVPEYVLAALPSTVNSSGMSNSPVAGELLVGPASGAVKFSTVPTGLDAAYLFYHFIAGSAVGWQ